MNHWRARYLFRKGVNQQKKKIKQTRSLYRSTAAAAAAARHRRVVVVIAAKCAGADKQAYKSHTYK